LRKKRVHAGRNFRCSEPEQVRNRHHLNGSETFRKGSIGGRLSGQFYEQKTVRIDQGNRNLWGRDIGRNIGEA